MSEFYIYILFRPDGRPCYVGKGKKNRIGRHFEMARQGVHPNPHLGNIIRNAGGRLDHQIAASGLDEGAAHVEEMRVIAAIGREAHGGPLVNQTDGGEGVSGYVPTAEERARSSARHKGNTYCLGHKASPETREKQRQAKLGTKHSPETKAKRSAIMKALPRSAEWKRNISEAQKARWARRKTARAG